MHYPETVNKADDVDLFLVVGKNTSWTSDSYPWEWLVVAGVVVEDGRCTTRAEAVQELEDNVEYLRYEDTDLTWKVVDAATKRGGVFAPMGISEEDLGLLALVKKYGIDEWTEGEFEAAAEWHEVLTD